MRFPLRNLDHYLAACVSFLTFLVCVSNLVQTVCAFNDRAKHSLVDQLGDELKVRPVRLHDEPVAPLTITEKLSDSDYRFAKEWTDS